MRALLCYTSLVLAAACLPSGPKADLVLRGGKIVTLSAERPVAEALAVTGGRITTIGTTAEINGLVGQETRVLDLNGALAVPGFIDSHAHFMGLGFAQLRLDLVGTRSSSEIARKLKDVAAAPVKKTKKTGETKKTKMMKSFGSEGTVGIKTTGEKKNFLPPLSSTEWFQSGRST